MSDRLRGLWAVFTTKIPQWVMCRLDAYPPAVCGCFDWCNRLHFASENVGSQLVRFRTTCTSLLAFSCSHIRQCPSFKNRPPSTSGVNSRSRGDGIRFHPYRSELQPLARVNERHRRTPSIPCAQVVAVFVTLTGQAIVTHAHHRPAPTTATAGAPERPMPCARSALGQLRPPCRAVLYSAVTAGRQCSRCTPTPIYC